MLNIKKTTTTTISYSQICVHEIFCSTIWLNWFFANIKPRKCRIRNNNKFYFFIIIINKFYLTEFKVNK